ARSRAIPATGHGPPHSVGGTSTVERPLPRRTPDTLVAQETYRGPSAALCTTLVPVPRLRAQRHDPVDDLPRFSLGHHQVVGIHRGERDLAGPMPVTAQRTASLANDRRPPARRPRIRGADPKSRR